MKPYSQGLRERVIAEGRAGQQLLAEIGLAFEVSESAVGEWHKRWKDTGSVAA